MGLLFEFRTFLLRGNVIDMAIAVIIGAVVSGLVEDLITPLIAAIGGNPDFPVFIWPIIAASSRMDPSSTR